MTAPPSFAAALDEVLVALGRAVESEDAPAVLVAHAKICLLEASGPGGACPACGRERRGALTLHAPECRLRDGLRRSSAAGIRFAVSPLPPPGAPPPPRPWTEVEDDVEESP